MDNNIGNNLQTNNNSVSPMNANGIKKWQINSLLVLILALVIILGFILYFIVFKKASSKSTTTIKTSSVNIKSGVNTTPKVSATADPYKGWLTYTNSTFSIEYPPSWTVRNDTANNIVSFIPNYLSNATNGINGTPNSPYEIDIYYNISGNSPIQYLINQWKVSENQVIKMNIGKFIVYKTYYNVEGPSLGISMSNNLAPNSLYDIRLYPYNPSSPFTNQTETYNYLKLMIGSIK